MANSISESGSFSWDIEDFYYYDTYDGWAGFAETYPVQFPEPFVYVIGSHLYNYASPRPGVYSDSSLSASWYRLDEDYDWDGVIHNLDQPVHDGPFAEPGYQVDYYYNQEYLWGLCVHLECNNYPPEIDYSLGDYTVEGFDAVPDDTIIFGIITDYEGNPVEGVTVTYKAEEDWINDHTGKFETITDIEGQYVINIEADDILAHDDYDWPEVKKIKDDLIVWGTAPALPVEDEEYFAIKKDVELGFQDEKTQDFQLKPPKFMIGSAITNCMLNSKRLNPFEIGKAITNLFISRPLKLAGSTITKAILNVDDGQNRLKGSALTSGLLLSSNYEKICYPPNSIISMTNMMSSDNEWVVADNPEEDISIRVSFPEPEYVPAGLISGQEKYKKQTFEMKVRKSTANKVDPVIQIYYYSNDMSISKSRKIKIVSTKGQTIKWHWLIGPDFEKKHVQCKVSSFSYNYGPVNKCGIDIEYIKWCGVYDLLANPEEGSMPLW